MSLTAQHQSPSFILLCAVSPENAGWMAEHRDTSCVSIHFTKLSGPPQIHLTDPLQHFLIKTFLSGASFSVLPEGDRYSKPHAGQVPEQVWSGEKMSMYIWLILCILHRITKVDVPKYGPKPVSCRHFDCKRHEPNVILSQVVIETWQRHQRHRSGDQKTYRSFISTSVHLYLLPNSLICAAFLSVLLQIVMTVSVAKNNRKRSFGL